MPIPPEVRYLYLRTKAPVLVDAKALIPIILRLKARVWILRPKGLPGWADGQVVQFYSRGETIPEIVERLKPYLAELDAWAIHNGTDTCIEPDGGRSAQMQFRDHPGDPRTPMAQIFLHYRENEWNSEGVSDKILAAIRDPARRSFHFRNGCVILTRTGQPTTLLVQRFRSFEKLVRSLVVTVGDQEETRDFSGVVDSAWHEISPVREIVFS